jgi:hypothetical protein
MNFIHDDNIYILGNINSIYSLQNTSNENAQNATGPLKT